MSHKLLKDGASHLDTGGSQLLGLIDGGVVVKWMLDWDIGWEEAGVTQGTKRCEESAWGCSGGWRWDGGPWQQ